MGYMYDYLKELVENVRSNLIHLVDNLHSEKGEEKIIIDGISYGLYDYLDKAVDVEYTVGANFDYRGARVAISFDRPTIYIDTRKRLVQGYMDDEVVETLLPTEVGDVIDQYYELEFNYTYN